MKQMSPRIFFFLQRIETHWAEIQINKYKWNLLLRRQRFSLPQMHSKSNHSNGMSAKHKGASNPSWLTLFQFFGISKHSSIRIVIIKWHFYISSFNAELTDEKCCWRKMSIPWKHSLKFVWFSKLMYRLQPT